MELSMSSTSHRKGQEGTQEMEQICAQEWQQRIHKYECVTHEFNDKEK